MTEKQILRLLGIAKEQIHECMNLLDDSETDQQVKMMLNQILLYIKESEFKLAIILRNPTANRDDYLEVNSSLSELIDYVSNQDVKTYKTRVFVILTSLNMIINSCVLSFPYVMLKRFKKQMTQDEINHLLKLITALSTTFCHNADLTCNAKIEKTKPTKSKKTDEYIKDLANLTSRKRG